MLSYYGIIVHWPGWAGQGGTSAGGVSSAYVLVQAGWPLTHYSPASARCTTLALDEASARRGEQSARAGEYGEQSTGRAECGQQARRHWPQCGDASVCLSVCLSKSKSAPMFFSEVRYKTKNSPHCREYPQNASTGGSTRTRCATKHLCRDRPVSSPNFTLTCPCSKPALPSSSPSASDLDLGWAPSRLGA